MCRYAFPPFITHLYSQKSKDLDFRILKIDRRVSKLNVLVHKTMSFWSFFINFRSAKINILKVIGVSEDYN